ncbi:MAG: hypothetical protein J6K29_01395 [Clostridia bacterium]|nr:hypothetical protein [Clostridia bacterium]
MKTKLTKLFCLVLAGLMLLSCFVACGDETDKPGEQSKDEAATEGDTVDEVQAALDDLGDIDYGGREFTVLYGAGQKEENYGVNETVDKDGGASQIINDAVYERNTLLEERCHLVYGNIEGDVQSRARTEASAPTGDFRFMDTSLRDSAALATNGYLYDFNAMNVDLDGPWWDSGTASFVLAGGVYFMTGSANTRDDGVTYVLIFNKDLRNTYSATIPNPYDTVKSWEWTLDYFNNVIQGISNDNGDGKWDELDTYGFINTWEYGNTFFLASDLRYVINDESVDYPELFLASSTNMEKALNVLELSRAIYHNNNASFMSPPGEEGKGLTAFKEGRGLFYGEVAQYLSALNREMTDGNYGVLPVPKYDKAQEFYRTWTHDSGSAFSVTSAIPEKDVEVMGQIMSAYAILSHQKLKPAYYDTMLKSRGVQDAESAEILDLIFQNRVYDLAFYFDLGFYDVFKSNVNDKNSERFSSAYSAAAKGFDRKLKTILRKLEKD